MRPASASTTSLAMSVKHGLPRIISCVIRVTPVMTEGIGRSGSIKVSIAIFTAPPQRTAIAISITRSPFPGLEPVVSTSTTAKVHSVNLGDPAACRTSSHRASKRHRTLGSDPSKALASRSATGDDADATPSTS